MIQLRGVSKFYYSKGMIASGISRVNLELDLNSAKKVEEYIPTSDICDVLKKYMKSFVNVNLEGII